MSADDVQVGGTHYQSLYQHWSYMADIDANYFEGCITKYVYRWRRKNGVQDLEKARHFLDKYIEVCTEDFVPSNNSLDDFTRFCYSNAVDVMETAIMENVLLAGSVDDLHTARRLLDDLIASEPARGYVNQ